MVAALMDRLVWIEPCLPTLLVADLPAGDHAVLPAAEDGKGEAAGDVKLADG